MFGPDRTHAAQGLRKWPAVTLLLMTSALVTLPGAALSQTLVWDAGDPSTPAVNNLDGNWNRDGDNRPWRAGGGPRAFVNGDNVEFREGDEPAEVTVTITEDVAPSSITFEDSLFNSTAFTINAINGAQILSTQGDVGGQNSGNMEIRMNDAAVINAGLSGRFTLLGTQALTLGGESLSLVSLTVSGNLPLTIAPGATLAGTINLNNGSLVIDGEDGNAGQVNNVNVGVGRTVTVNEFGVVTGLLDNRGTATIDGTVATLTNRNGGTVTINSTGEVTGLLDNSGTATIDGTVANLTNRSGGTVTLNSTGEVTGLLDNSGTATVDGTVAELINRAGTLDLNATGEVTGQLENRGTATVAGNVGTLLNSMSGNMTFDGSITVGAGGFTNTGSAIAAIQNGVTLTAETSIEGGSVTINSGGSIVGATTIIGGRLTINAGGTQDGAVGVGPSGQLVVNGEVIGNVLSEGEVEIGGAVTGDVNNQATGNLTMTGSISGSLTNAGEAGIAGSLGSLLNTGDVSFDGATTIAGLTENEGGMDVAAGVTLTATGGLQNRNGGAVEVLAGGSIAGAITNRTGSVVTLRGGTSTTGGFANEGTLVVDGAVTVEGLTSSGTIRMTDGGTGDVLTLTGPATLNGQIELDIDLSDATASSDRIVSSDTITGNVALAFTNVGPSFGALETPLTVMSFAQGGTFGLPTFTGLNGVGAVVYTLDLTAPTDGTTPVEVRVISFANPGAGAVVGSVTLTQSLIGSVINRPSSPFVTGSATQGDKACRPGVWARALGGRADATGTTQSIDTVGTARDYDSVVKADYSGIQLGGDISCFDGFFGGWDMSFGGILGVNSGSTFQPVFAINSSTGEANPGLIVSNNFTDFRQTYAGVYMSAVKDRLLLDLQYRLERTSFDLRNDGAPDSAERIGIIDQSFDSKGHTISGSMSYVFPVNKEMGINFVPTAGFAITKFSTDSLAFSEGGRLDIDDGSTEVGFIGAALSMSRILPSGNAALTYFATGTYYKDFADPLRSVYTGGGSGGTNEIYSSNLGQYGEASIGLNYTQILQPGNAILNAKQLNASVRLDGRFGETLDSWGLTAQMRLQF